MRLALRIALAAFAFLGAAPAAAQDAAAPAPAENRVVAPAVTLNNTAPAEDAVGPPQLRDFSLNGTVTRRAEPPPQRAAPPARTPSARAPARGEGAGAGPLAAAPPRPQPSVTPSMTAPAVDQADTGIEVAPIPLDAAPQPQEQPLPVADDLDASDAPTLPVLPWAAALAFAAAAAGWFLYRRRRMALAAGHHEPQFSLHAAPEAAAPAQAPPPEAVPAPAPVKAPPQVETGIVTTRLRPWLDVSFEPDRAVIDAERGLVEFEVAIQNSGGAPAREVLVEAALFNAGDDQDQTVGAFIARPVGRGERIPLVPPLRSMRFKSSVSLNRAQLREYVAAGRKVFVPVVAVNVLYRWSGGDAQTSASFLVGRNGRGEKLAPLHLDSVPREFRGLAARPLEQRVRK